MHACSRIPRGVLRLAVAAWAALSLSACVPSAIDRERASLSAAPAIAERAAAQAQLALVHHQARHGLSLDAGARPRPVASRGAIHDGYRRWLEGKVLELPDPSDTVATAGE